MRSDSIKPKNNLEPFSTDIFPSTKDWISGPKDPTVVQRLFWFTDGSWTEQGTEARTYGPKTRLFFPLGKEICKRRLWK
jgi:hypothetical protein